MLYSLAHHSLSVSLVERLPLSSNVSHTWLWPLFGQVFSWLLSLLGTLELIEKMIELERGLVLLIIITIKESLMLNHLTLIDVRWNIWMVEILLTLVYQINLILAPFIWLRLRFPRTLASWKTRFSWVLSGILGVSWVSTLWISQRANGVSLFSRVRVRQILSRILHLLDRLDLLLLDLRLVH